jgi:peptide/nickel transport system ATP-binding protein
MIALAIVCSPSLLIADEPTTALDVTIQAQILDLMRRVQKEMGMSILFITHDMGVVAEMADDVAVMYAGAVVEKASVAELFVKTRHPYTQGLLSSIPLPGREEGTLLVPIPGSVPALHSMPAGCAFAPRCRFNDARCDAPIGLTDSSPDHWVACVRAKEVLPYV